MKTYGIPSVSALREEAAHWRAPFFTALVVGLLAHGYAFFNKLVNHDEIESLFGKGATVTSGRWGLELVKILFPDWSMPWIYGAITLLLMAAAVCVMLRLLQIRSKALQMLLAALVISFPTLTGNFCFMFTSAPYAWAFLLAVFAAALFWEKRPLSMAVGLVLLVLALGIYQSYIAVVASLCVLKMMAEAMDAERPVGRIVLDGVRALLWMSAAIAVYYAATLLAFRVTGAAFNTYVTENVNGSVSMLRRVRMAYDNFLYIFTFRNFYVISSELARYLHLLLAAGTGLGMAVLAVKKRSLLHAGLLVVLAALLPLSICCMFLIMSKQSIHTLVMYSFTAVYFLTALVLERLPGTWGRRSGALAGVMLAAVVLSNVYFANMTYLKLQLQYENAYAFYTVLTARLTSLEGFDEHSRLAFVGRQETLLHRFPELDTELLMGPSPDLVNIYSRENLLRYYLGFDVPFASQEDCAALENDPVVQAMPVYPYEGSVRKIGDLIVIRLG